LLSGFGAKVLTTKNLLPWQAIAMNVAALGTAISFAKFIFLPHKADGEEAVKPGFWPAVSLLLAGLFAANVVYYEAYSLENIVKPLATIGLGWLAYLLIFKRAVLKLPRVIEQFEHLIGGMSLMLILLFWMVMA
jgi:multicomponent Na+:H+ antiporter subunit D